MGEQVFTDGPQVSFRIDKLIERLSHNAELDAKIDYPRYRLAYRSLSDAEFRRRHLEVLRHCCHGR